MCAHSINNSWTWYSSSTPPTPRTGSAHTSPCSCAEQNTDEDDDGDNVKEGGGQWCDMIWSERYHWRFFPHSLFEDLRCQMNPNLPGHGKIIFILILITLIITMILMIIPHNDIDDHIIGSVEAPPPNVGLFWKCRPSSNVFLAQQLHQSL